MLEDYSDASRVAARREAYEKLDYCVQYNETDFDFVSRLLEEAGIYYYFEHEEDAHTMVFIDAIGKHEPHPGRRDDHVAHMR